MQLKTIEHSPFSFWSLKSLNLVLTKKELKALEDAREVMNKAEVLLEKYYGLEGMYGLSDIDFDLSQYFNTGNIDEFLEYYRPTEGFKIESL